MQCSSSQRLRSSQPPLLLRLEHLAILDIRTTGAGFKFVPSWVDSPFKSSWWAHFRISSPSISQFPHQQEPSTMNNLPVIFLLLVLLGAHVSTHPTSFGNYILERLARQLADQLTDEQRQQMAASPPMLRYERSVASGWRHIGLGKRASGSNNNDDDYMMPSAHNRVSRTADPTIRIMNMNGRHLAMIGLGRK